MKREIRLETIKHPVHGEIERKYVYTWNENSYISLDEAISIRNKYNDSLLLKQAEFDTNILSEGSNKKALSLSFQKWQSEQDKGYETKELYIEPEFYDDFSIKQIENLSQEVKEKLALALFPEIQKLLQKE